jgi:hypothetical protein
VYIPVKQAWINDRIPSTERATIISLDALFGDAGNTAGQLGLGYVSTAVSIPAAWLVGGLAQALGLPLLGAARRAQVAGEARLGEGREARTAAATVAAGPTVGCVCDAGFAPCCAPADSDARERAA